jgi:hypothetical protein
MMSFLPVIVIFLAFVALGIWANWNKRDEVPEPPELEYSMDWHRINGECRVLYTDTVMPSGRFAVSQPMTRAVAEGYAKMFNGVVIGRNAEVPFATQTPNRA